jgi:hypothetical protein
MRIKTISILLLVALFFVSLVIQPATAQEGEGCLAGEPKTAAMQDGITLTWDSSFLCMDVTQTGEYAITVTVQNDATSQETVQIETLGLFHTTPRPRGNVPSATAMPSGLPLTLAPGESGSIEVSGSYELVQTGDGHKANLHLRASGYVLSTNDVIHLGINVMLRGEGFVEDENGEPPAWAPGPPPWAGTMGDDEDGEIEDGGPPTWAPGPPPWAGEEDGEADESEGDGPPSWVPGPPPWIGKPGNPNGG